MPNLTFAAECPRCHMLWNQRYNTEQLRASVAGELELEFWCQQCGDSFAPDAAQLERLHKLVERESGRS